MNDGLPDSISPDPILEAIFEIRFAPRVPPEAVAGLVLAAVRGRLPECVSLPAAQLPDLVRLQDPNLAYNPTQLHRDGRFLLKAGPRVLTFSQLQPYPGWTPWWRRVADTVEALAGQAFFGGVERVGLRYVNFFDRPVLADLNLAIELVGQTVDQYPSLLKFELPDSGMVKSLQVSNRVNLQIDGGQRQGSLVDIDCLQPVGLGADDFMDRLEPLAAHCHAKAKELFFGLLKPRFLAELDPVYRD